jgi:polysaccharide biosynthesis protein PslA
VSEEFESSFREDRIIQSVGFTRTKSLLTTNLRIPIRIFFQPFILTDRRKLVGPDQENCGTVEQGRQHFLPRKTQLGIKRFVDISGALFGLVFLSIPFLLLAVAIKFTSSGPIFFRQVRIGLDNQPFEILKFRTMHAGVCDTSGIRQTSLQDNRVTPLGKILRRTSIDELPQLMNVLKGDMSLVGPRPHVDGMLAAGMPYNLLITNYDERHAMRPGITGLAQVEGYRGPTTELDAAVGRVARDLCYIELFSLWLDAKIITKTIINELFKGTGD